MTPTSATHLAAKKTGLRDTVSKSRVFLTAFSISFVVSIATVFGAGLNGSISAAATSRSTADETAPQSVATRSNDSQLGGFVKMNGEPSNSNVETPFRFWRAPSDEIARWPWGDEKYFPIRVSTFDEWLRATADAENAARRVAGDVVSSLLLDAKLDGNALEGSGEIAFSIVESPELAPPTALPLRPFSFVLSSLTERRSDGDRPAFVGLYPDSQLYLADPKSGAYSFRWSQRGTPLDATGTLAFDVVFPASPQTEFRLETPLDATLVSSEGVVEKLEPTENSTLSWRVFLSGKSQTRLTIIRAAAAPNVRYKTGFQQETSYRISLEGTEVVSRFVFDRSESSFDEATLTLDAPLVPLSFEWDDRKDGELDATRSTDAAGATTVKIRRPARRDADPFGELKITAFCPLRLNVDERLPAINLLSDALFWRETICRLTVVRPIFATSVRPLDAAQAREPLRTRQEGEDFYSFKFFAPNGGVAAEFQPLLAEASFDSATDCLIVPNEISAKTTLFFDGQNVGDLRRVVLPLASDWEIDSVRSTSDDSIVWSRDENADGRALIVSFKNVPASDRSTRLSVSARYAGSFDGNIAVDRLCPFDLSNALRGAHALVLRAESPNRIKLSTRADQPFVAPTSTPNFIGSEAQLRDALPASSGLERLYFGDQTADAVASLENLKSNYSAELSGFGELREATFCETWRLRCAPTSGSRVDRVVFFVAPSSERTIAAEIPWTWSTSTEPDRVFLATKLPDEETVAFDAPEEATAFEIRLATPRSVPFELNLFKTIPATREIQTPLLFFPEAEIEQAEFVVESRSGYPFWTRAELLDATPSPLAPPDEYDALKYAFRYVPVFSKNGRAVKTPRLDVLLDPPENPNAPTLDVLVADAWCWFETFDSFYETNGTVRNRVTFFIENRGRSSLLLTAPVDLDRATRAVWLDDRRVPWRVEKIDDAANGIRVALAPDRRFLCVGVEYCLDGAPPSVRRRLIPSPIVCDIPILSGVWNAWTPPELQICDRPKASAEVETDSASTVDAIYRAFEKTFSFQNGERRAEIERRADRFSTRFGDENALRQAVQEAQNAVEKNVESDAATNNATNNLPTWGDVFGSATTIAQLFAPGVDEQKLAANANDGETSAGESASESDAPTTIETPFGTLAPTPEMFRLYIDRFALARLPITPTTPIVRPNYEKNASQNDPQTIAAKTLENAKVVLLIVDADVALLTTNDALFEFDARSIETIRSSAIRTFRSRSDARTFAKTLLDETNPRYLAAASWRGVANATSPWKERPREENAPGWTRTTTTLERASDGIRVADRYRLATLQWFCFVAFVVVAWRRSFAKPAFFIGIGGACVAAQYVASFEISVALRGIAWGTLCAFGFYLVRFRLPDAPPQTSLRRSRRDVSPDGDNSPVEIVVRDELNVPRRRVATTSAREEDDESTQGFVDLSKLPLSAFRSSEKTPTPPPNVRSNGVRKNESANGSVENTPQQSSNNNLTTDLSADRKGAISMKTTAILTFVSAAFFLVASVVRAAVDVPRPTSASGTGAGTASAAVPNATSPALNAADPIADVWREPFRVFVPVDGDQNPVGPYYWIPEEFYEHIRTVLKTRPRERNWRVVDAFYEGVVNYNGFAETTSLFNLKATYKIYLDSTRATIALPATQLVPDVGAKFDKQTIAPVFEEGGKEFYFEIADATPGEHTLELTLVPPQFSETNSQISLPIPRVPSARLELSVPVDAPPLDVPNAQGKVSRGNERLVAELGAVDRLIVTKSDSDGKSGRTTVDVEQYFLMRARPTQTDVRASFHYQIVGGKIQTLSVDCDPAYAFSGYCQCDRAEIESIDPPTSQNDSMRVSFKKPISGSFSLTLDFVARNFSGIGRVRLPQISTQRTRILKNWLALSPSGDVKCANLPDSSASVAAFQNAWGTLDETPIAVYDLATTEPGLPISTLSSTSRPIAAQTTTVVFRPTQIETRCFATLDAPTELFRLELETPRPFAIDSLAVFDEKGTALEAPVPFLSSDGLSLVFQTPLKGKYSLRIVGRTKTTLDAARAFPTFSLRDVDFSERQTRVYCGSDVYLDWIPPFDWEILDASTRDALETLDPSPTENVYRVESFDVLPPLASPVSVAIPDVVPEIISNVAPVEPLNQVAVRVNNPQIGGVQRVVLYRKTSDSWKVFVDFRLTIRGGRVDRFRVAADDSYSLEPLASDSDFAATEVQLATGGRALVFQPKKALGSTANFQFVATLKNDLETIRLPRFRLLPATPRESVADVKRFAFLPTRVDAKPLRWETQNLRAVSRDAAVAREALEDATKTMTRSTAALALSGSANETIFIESIPASVAHESGMQTEDFLIFESLNAADGASISSGRDQLQITRAEHAFYLNSQRQFFGASTFSIRPSSINECVVVVPPSCRILEATVNGSRRLAERLDDRRWRIDLDATRFGKRLEIAFQGVGNFVADAPRSFFGSRTTAFDFEMPRVENATPERSVWTCAFDAFDDVAPRWQIFSRNVGESDEPIVPEERVGNLREPIATSDANELLFRLCVGKATELLDAFEYDAALFANVRGDDFDRRRERWDRDWRQCENEISRFFAPDRAAGLLTDRQKNAVYLADSDAPNDAENDFSTTLDRWTLVRYREILERKKKLEETYPRADANASADATTNFAPREIWTLDRALNARLLFVVTDENVERLVVVAPAKRLDFVASPYASTIFILAATFVLLGLFKTDAKSRRFKCSLFGSLVAFWALAFFVVDWKLVGLIGVVVLALEPPILAAFSRRKERRDANATKLDDPNAFNVDDGGTTELLAPPDDANDAPNSKLSE